MDRDSEKRALLTDRERQILRESVGEESMPQYFYNVRSDVPDRLRDLQTDLDIIATTQPGLETHLRALSTHLTHIINELDDEEE